MVKWFKSNPLELSELKTNKVLTMKNPEGTKVQCLMFKTTQSIPDGLPFFKLEMFAEEFSNLEDIFIDRAEDLHERQALFTHQLLRQNNLEDRVVRAAGVSHLMIWSEFQEKVDSAQKAMTEKEEEALRQMRLAETGQAAETMAATVVTGSRFRRRGEEAEAEVVPAKRRAGRGGRGRGGAGRGNARPVVAPGPSVAASDGASVVGSSYSTPRKTHHPGAASVAPSGAETPLASIAPTADARNEKLRLLLTSNHGKMFPSILEILSGTQIKRELSGARSSESYDFPIVLAVISLCKPARQQTCWDLGLTTVLVVAVCW